MTSLLHANAMPFYYTLVIRVLCMYIDACVLQYLLHVWCVFFMHEIHLIADWLKFFVSMTLFECFKCVEWDEIDNFMDFIGDRLCYLYDSVLMKIQLKKFRH